MPNPVRPWRNFLTAWERLDEEAQAKYTVMAARTLTQLRKHQKDIEGRIVYWEANLANAQKARRLLEFKGRTRARYDQNRKAKP